MKNKNKSIKNNGSYIFGDFSYGLYLLDTPRFLGEQLASLALKGGQNVWCEKGALIPQYGYAKKPSIGTNDRIVAVSKDSYSGSSFFILCQSGKVYYYSSAQGIKEYKTQFETTPTDVKVARRGNDLILSMAGGTYLFGSYYNDEDLVTINTSVPAADYSTYMEFQVPTSSEKYYWTGKEIDVSGIGKATITSINNDLGKVLSDINLVDLQDKSYHLARTLTVASGVNDVVLSPNGDVIKVIEEVKTETTYETTTTAGWKCFKFKHNGSFKGRTPEEIYALFLYSGLPLLPEGYIYIREGAKVGDPVYCRRSNQATPVYYKAKGNVQAYTANEIPASDSELVRLTTYWENQSYSKNPIQKYSFVIQSMDSNGNVTSIGTSVSDANSKCSTSRYTNGDKGSVEIQVPTGSTTSTVRKLQLNLNINGTMHTFNTGYLANGSYKLHLIYDRDNNLITIEIRSGSATIFTTQVSGNLDIITNAQEGDILKDFELLDEDGNVLNMEDAEIVVIRAVSANKDRNTLANFVTLSERTMHETTFKYRPEDQDITDLPYEFDDLGKYYAITPQLMEWCNNRLFISDVSGNIFYSQVGIVDGFEEKYGAGYFGGFYNDTSNLLAFDDFKDGVLITKENGMYYLTISNDVTYSQQGDYLTVANNNVKIEKVSEIGQKYPQDHIVVKERVYAYDSNSGSIVNAISQNVFGSLVAGKTLVSADYLNAQDLGIDHSTNRALVYNSEADVFILYYGEFLNRGVVYSPSYDSLFPRKLPCNIQTILSFNQGIVLIDADTNDILEDFKKGTIVPDIAPVADFEPIGLRDNKFISSSIIEITELNGIEYDLITSNITSEIQHIQPNSEIGKDKALYPNMLYSEFGNASRTYESFELTSKWAEKNSNLTRMYAPMSGRYGVSINLTFPANQDFCLSMIRLPDFSQGE